MQKTVFITGASAGLGKATAKLFQAKGWNVIATMRNPDKETELNQLQNVTLLQLDVSNTNQIDQVVNDTLHNHSVDVVVNNAGYGLIGVLEALSDDQIIRQVNTNLLGVIRVTKAFIPYFREKQNGVFINISSMLGLWGYPTCSVYSATKFAIDGFSESLAYELAAFGIQVKIIAPGGIKTDFAGRSLEGAEHNAYSKLEKKVMEGYTPEMIEKFASPESIATVIYNAAVDGNSRLRYVVGKDAEPEFQEIEELGGEAHFNKLKNRFIL
ncbi:SDR family oxidoreductase [Flavobacterium terrisoli]|uniref:SDR family oxidoreductase n=1 Tax=Flavobacterium terrisoli TaxID=3242195 RepID=UPI002543A91E|nr:SDR family oxidoreductase [Flavobacterium buctense]